LIGSENGAKLEEILEDETAEVYTCALTLAELVSKVAREGKDAEISLFIIFEQFPDHRCL
jgi:predicted nucleic acid-binding protein